MNDRGWVYCDGKIIGFMTYQIYGKFVNIPYLASFNGDIKHIELPINYINNKLVVDFDSLNSVNRQEILNHFTSSPYFIPMPETHLTKLLR